jgi:lysophospholipase L1-like esterase
MLATAAAVGILALWPATAAPAVPRSGVAYPVSRSLPGPARGYQRAGEPGCEQELERAARSGGPRLVIVGASFTAGVGSGPGRSWAVLLARYLRWDGVVYGVPGAGYVRAGAGRRGPVAAEIARVGLRALHPALVIVQAGHDDIGVPPGLERRRVAQAVAMIQAEAPQARIVLLTVFAGRSPRAAAYRTDQAIVQAARSADRTVIIIDPLAAGWTYSRVRDGLHPTAAGSAWIAGRVAAILREHGVRPVPAGPGRHAIICDTATAQLRRRSGQGRVCGPGRPGSQGRQPESHQRPAGRGRWIGAGWLGKTGRSVGAGWLGKTGRSVGAGWLGKNSLGPDRPAVALGYLADDGQPEAGAGDSAGLRRAVEAVEHVGQVGGRDPGSVIAHGELAGVQAHLDRGARRTEFRRVVQEVPDRGLQPLGAAADYARLKVRGEDGLRPVPAGAFQRGGDHLGEVHLVRRGV